MSLQPIAVDLAPYEKRNLRVSESPRSLSTSLTKHKMSPFLPQRSRRSDPPRFREGDEQGSRHGHLRVAVFIAMPAQREHQIENMLCADREIVEVQSMELCIGTAQVSTS